MFRLPPSYSASCFFSTFHRFITLFPPPTHHIRPIPLSKHHSSYNRHSSVSSFTRCYASKSPGSHSSQPSTSTPSLPTHYELFPNTMPKGPPPHGPFSVGLGSLRREYLYLQSLAHPDRHPTASDKLAAEQASTIINEAYHTLLDPLKRAQYILRLRGIDVAGDEGAKLSADTDEAGEGDMGLLSEVMEIREAIEDAKAEAEIEELKRVNEERIGQSVEVLEACFARDDLVGAKGEAVKLRYWVNVKESLDGWEEGKGASAIVH